MATGNPGSEKRALLALRVSRGHIFLEVPFYGHARRRNKRKSETTRNLSYLRVRLPNDIHA